MSDSQKRDSFFSVIKELNESKYEKSTIACVVIDCSYNVIVGRINDDEKKRGSSVW